ncbi:serine/threonine-protein kinase TOR, partial [Kipferlia bialata]|eukprot:g3896.t1
MSVHATGSSLPGILGQYQQLGQIGPKGSVRDGNLSALSLSLTMPGSPISERERERERERTSEQMPLASLQSSAAERDRERDRERERESVRQITGVVLSYVDSRHAQVREAVAMCIPKLARLDRHGFAPHVRSSLAFLLSALRTGSFKRETALRSAGYLVSVVGTEAAGDISPLLNYCKLILSPSAPASASAANVTATLSFLVPSALCAVAALARHCPSIRNKVRDMLALNATFPVDETCCWKLTPEVAPFLADIAKCCPSLQPDIQSRVLELLARELAATTYLYEETASSSVLPTYSVSGASLPMSLGRDRGLGGENSLDTARESEGETGSRTSVDGLSSLPDVASPARSQIWSSRTPRRRSTRLGRSVRVAMIGRPLSKASQPTVTGIIEALKILSSFDFTGVLLCSFLRSAVLSRYLGVAHTEIRLLAALSLCHTVSPPFLKNKILPPKFTSDVSLILDRLVVVAVSDLSDQVRHAVLVSLPHCVDRLLCASDTNLQRLFFAVNDGCIAVSEAALTVIGRLSSVSVSVSTAQCIPFIRKTLVQLLSQIEGGANVEMRAYAARLLSRLISSSKSALKAYVSTILDVLLRVLRDNEGQTEITTPLIAALGELAALRSVDFLPSLGSILCSLRSALLDSTDAKRQKAAVRSLGLLSQNTGVTSAIVETQAPGLSKALLGILSSGTSDKALRVEATRVLGILGPLDPMHYRQTERDREALRYKGDRQTERERERDSSQEPKTVEPVDTRMWLYGYSAKRRNLREKKRERERETLVPDRAASAHELARIAALSSSSSSSLSEIHREREREREDQSNIESGIVDYYITGFSLSLSPPLHPYSPQSGTVDYYVNSALNVLLDGLKDKNASKFYGSLSRGITMVVRHHVHPRSHLSRDPVVLHLAEIFELFKTITENSDKSLKLQVIVHTTFIINLLALPQYVLP